VSASNDINERAIKEFNLKGHALDILGIGTNLVTCQLQPFVEITSRKGKALSNMEVLFKNGVSVVDLTFLLKEIRAKICDKMKIYNADLILDNNSI
jgi:hypothetical protein